MAVTLSDQGSHQPASPRGLAVAAAVGCLLLAGTAGAQEQGSTGPRYLSWASRTTSTTPADTAARRARTGVIPRRVAPSQGLARPPMQPFNPPMPVSDRGLTPASAWIGPRVAPAFAPGVPDPLSYATTELAAAPPPPPAPARSAPTAAMAPVARAPASTTSAVAAPMGQPLDRSATALPSAVADDPMAPRRDAPIFRLASGTSAPVADTDSASAQAPRESVEAAPDRTGEALPPTRSAQPQAGQAPSRYYSVHRAAGRQPDRTVIPDPVFFDSVALDLAAPEDIELPVRDAQGRLRPPANSDPSLP